VSTGAQATTLVVGDCPTCYPTVQEAIDAAQHNDVIEIEPGTYTERVHLYPKTADQFYLTIRGQASAQRPTITYAIGSGVPVDQNNAVFEVHNVIGAGQPSCEDMRLWFENIALVATDDYTSAFSVWSAVDDVNHDANTGLFVERCYFESSRLKGGAVWIGVRPTRIPSCHPLWGQCLVNQSIKWGYFRDNEIVTLFPDNGLPIEIYLADAVSCFHFTGRIENNRMTSTAEGWHLGYAQLGPNVKSWLANENPDHITTRVQHNVAYCNEQLGIHFTHGSEGTVNNNIVVRSWYEHLDDASGITVGVVAPTISGYCDEEPDECGNGGLSVPTDVVIHNNTIDRCEGVGIWVTDGNKAELHSNIISRTKDLPGIFQSAYTVGLAVKPPGAYDPSEIDSDHTVFWQNRVGPITVDYDPATLEDPTDVNDDDINPPYNGSNPWYQGGANPFQQYSYMLQSDEEALCGYALGERSRAIDAGRGGLDFFGGSIPPGFDRPDISDAGAFGGEFNVWDYTGATKCLQYEELNPAAQCEE